MKSPIYTGINDYLISHRITITIRDPSITHHHQPSLEPSTLMSLREEAGVDDARRYGDRSSEYAVTRQYDRSVVPSAYVLGF